MNPATQTALLLFLAGWLQSFVYLCGKLPPDRLPAGYPRSANLRALFNLVWLTMFAVGLGKAWRIDPWLALVGAALYFGVLPFAFQLPLVRLFGFRNYRQFMDAVDARDDGPQPPKE